MTRCCARCSRRPHLSSCGNPACRCHPVATVESITAAAAARSRKIYAEAAALAQAQADPFTTGPDHGMMTP